MYRFMMRTIRGHSKWLREFITPLNTLSTESNRERTIKTIGEADGKSTETPTFLVPASLKKVPSPTVKSGRRRNRPGTKASALSLNFSDAESLREKLHCLVCKDPSDIKRIVALPNGADRTRWIYEHLRRFVLELNKLVVALRRSGQI